MSKRTFSQVLLSMFALLALSSMWVGCGSDLVSGLLIGDAKEIEIGEGVDAQIEAEYRILESNDAVTLWARQLVAPLEDASASFRDPADLYGGAGKDTNVAYSVEVLYDDELVNAFAAPGGYTYISTGLILNASTCAEIAGVMGHELAHVTQRHSVKMITEATALDVVAGFIFGDDSLTGDAAGAIYGFMASTSFSQDNESESDIVGMQISYNAGYNPYGLVDFFQKLLDLSGGGNPLQFLSSHPATDERIATISAEIQNRYGNQVQRGIRSESGGVVSFAGATQTYDCPGQLSLQDVQALIRSGNVQVRAGTGTGAVE